MSTSTFKDITLMLYQLCNLTLDSLSSSSSVESHADAQIFFYLYISCLIVSSCYTLVWDLKMDWGLFDRNAGENTFLREEIVYPHKVFVHAGSNLRVMKQNNQ